MAARAIDHYMRNLERTYACGYIRLGRDPATGAYPERQPPWQIRPIYYRQSGTYVMTAKERRISLANEIARMESGKRET